VAANNYAAALLINRAQPDEAINVTRQLLQQMPDALVPRVNHASALLMNRRTAEAQELLAKIDETRLTAEEACQYYRAMFEVWLNLGKTSEAWAAYDRVDKSVLYPLQAQWLEAAAKSLPPR
jgi:predicted Zn-dependent protease